MLVSLAAAAAAVLSLPGAAALAASPVVHEISQTGTVDPLTARYVERALGRAAREGAAAALIRIDTPGGLDSSMRAIVQAIQRSAVPVLCWVGPSGARAASAGAFILISCPVAAMAPGTNVGAAHPVGLSGEVVGEKVTNDAAAYIRSLAEQRGRNADWAERAVRLSVSASAKEALSLHVVDLIAPSIPALLDAVDGTTVPVRDGRRALAVAGARVVRANLTPGEAILHNLVDPNIAFLFFVFGIAGIVYEVLNPGLNVAGVVGLLMLISSFVIFGMLPVNLAGLILIAAAIAFFVIDLHVAGHGLPTLAGIVSLVLGGLFLFNAEVPNARVSRGLVVGVGVATGAMFTFLIRAIVTARRQQPIASESVVGSVGTVRVALDPQGVVRARGEDWTARTAQGPIPAGTSVVVTAINGLTLEVEAEGARSEEHVGTEGG
jgi:membrane-bound serine protease (ClpP class)